MILKPPSEYNDPVEVNDTALDVLEKYCVQAKLFVAVTQANDALLVFKDAVYWSKALILKSVLEVYDNILALKLFKDAV